MFRAAAASQLSSEQPTRALNSQEKDACIGSLSLKLYRLTVAQAGHQLCGGLRHTHREVKSVAIWDGGQGEARMVARTLTASQGWLSGRVDQSLGFWFAEIAKSPLLPKLTPLGLRGITPFG